MRDEQRSTVTEIVNIPGQKKIKVSSKVVLRQGDTGESYLLNFLNIMCWQDKQENTRHLECNPKRWLRNKNMNF